MAKAPLRYRQFINSLLFLEVCVPVFPRQAGTEFMLFRSSGSGYYPTPSGPNCPFVHREDDEPVPVKEIEKTLMHLGIPAEIFWNLQDDLAQQAKQAQSAKAAAGSSAQGTDQSKDPK